MVQLTLILIWTTLGIANSAEESTAIKDASTPKILETSTSDKQEVKVEHKSATSSDEKLGTSSTILQGFGIPAGIIYDAPLTSGAYAGFGGHPGSYVAPAYGGHGVHGGHGQVMPHGNTLGNPYHGDGYGGVVYQGYGKAPIGQEHVSINKQSEIGVGPYGEVLRGDTIQKTINRVEPAAIPIGVPYSPYGHGGVVYMGNGLISEHAAGVKQVGPVLPPPGYQQQQHVAINKQSAIGPYGDVHQGVTVKSTVNSVGGAHAPVLGGYHQHGFPPHQGGFYQQGHHHGFNGGYPHGVPYPHHQQVSISQNAQRGIDHYGNVHNGVNIQKDYRSVPGVPGLGYNGLPNQVIAHTDQAIVEKPYYDGRGYSNPDPYYNNLVDPILRNGGIGHSTTLLTTGPNKYYQGKNPIGVYERYHRFG